MNEELRREPTTLTQKRLDDGYNQLYDFVPGVENLTKIKKELKRHGLQPMNNSKLKSILNSDLDTNFDVSAATLADVNDEKQTPDTTRRTEYSKDDIIAFFIEGIRYHLRKEMEEALDASPTAAATLSDFDKLQKKHNSQKTLPKGILDTIQQCVLQNYPKLQVAVNWFANRLKSWDDILGYHNTSSGSGSGSSSGNKGDEEGKDGDDNDKEEEEAIEGDSDTKTTKLHETITFSFVGDPS
ncbi:hypothetical protein BDB00DRAFT_874615 [Zychaea mexicana]|uniref:uncharacterized protein n=1 Tax=Zychaea mexicana TaxID=64656 RepID=UPI0022FEE3F9|nr:uncharacterized protein BDB00DRAFT_874615 [Zychaea mexicana]KAI9491223.1 hypothetical protein BDB00DRAFT_874615 [Zychaea mexicana]